MEYGLIGGKLGHSYSKEIHEQIADYEYELKELKPEELDGFLKARAFRAINVTIPYKQDVIPYLDEVDEQAKKIGAVNTIVNRDGKLFGYNTDLPGMLALIRRIGMNLSGKKVLILGTGGTSKTAHAAASFLDASEILHVSRSAGREGAFRTITYREAETEHTDAQAIINTTPSGMFPNIETVPIDLSGFTQLEGVLDAVYNPLRTNLVLDAAERGARAEGGLFMLAAQAVYACGHFLNRTVSEEEILKAFQTVRDEKRNLVLCGMPSCGKTTIAARLSELTGRRVVDTDARIVQRIGMEIAAFSAQHGEQAFRDVESEVVKEAAAESGVILATGGGAILREENVRALKRNGLLIFIDRPLEKLAATADRPFSANPEALKQRFEERYEIYCKIADVHLDGSGIIEEVAQAILNE